MISFLGLAVWSAAQVYPVGRRSVNWVDPARGNRTVGVELAYPGISSGQNVALADDSLKFPVVVFGHGFLMPASAYQWLADSLATRGFLVAFPTTEGGISPSHAQFGQDLLFVARRIIQLNDSASSFLLGRVHPRFALAGHSMGGGASFLAAASGSSASALFNFAAAETNPSAKAAAAQTQVPSLIFSGSGDCIVRDTNQLRMYNLVPYPCKTYVNLTQVLHCQFGNNDPTCVIGQVTSFCNSTPVSTVSVFQRTLQLIVPFLNYYLKSDCTALASFEQSYTNLAGAASKARSCNSDPFICDPSTRLRFYRFDGSGSWDAALNWYQQRIPPISLPAGSEILINGAATGAAMLERGQQVLSGSRLVVLSGKQLFIAGNLTID